jgi:hypothetical protein
MEIAFARERRRVLDELGPYFSEQLEASCFAEREFEGHIETLDGYPPRTDTIVGQTLVLTARLANDSEPAHEVSLRLGHDHNWEPVISVRTEHGEMRHLVATGERTQVISAAKELIRRAFAKVSCAG